MTTIYNWSEPATLSGAVDSANDLLFLFDFSSGRTVTVAAGELQTTTAQTTASNLGTIAATSNSVALIGTSTSVFLSAPTKVGIWKYIMNNSSSTVAYTVTASGSSFNTGSTIYTSGGGGSITAYAQSTLKWITAADFSLTLSTGGLDLS